MGSAEMLVAPGYALLCHATDTIRTIGVRIRILTEVLGAPGGEHQRTSQLSVRHDDRRCFLTEPNSTTVLTFHASSPFLGIPIYV